MGIIKNQKKMMLRQLYSRGLHMVAAKPRQVRMFHNMLRMQQAQLNNQNQFALVNINQRAFGKKKKDYEETPTEDEAVVEEAVAQEVAEEVAPEEPATPPTPPPPPPIELKEEF